jgi:hypothetical protein
MTRKQLVEFDNVDPTGGWILALEVVLDGILMITAA